jgi:hypothetical protein
MGSYLRGISVKNNTEHKIEQGVDENAQSPLPWWERVRGTFFM